MNRKITLILMGLPFLFLTSKTSAQIDDSQVGGWYMYFWTTTLGESPWGFQGDVQYRNWDLIGDLEQLLLRGGVTYTPKGTKTKLTLGYASITTGAFGDDNSTVIENRIYQEALIPQKIGNRIYLTHRFRYEQRFVESQDFRTRFRYNLFMNVPLNGSTLDPGTFYIALYNELFINGEQEIGNNSRVNLFDRNRTYGALGYAIVKGLRVQLGWMQQTTESINKGQTQLSLHHSF